MLQSLQPYLKLTTSRSIPPYQLWLKSQKGIIKERYNRLYGSIGHETRAVKMLRYILNFVDLEYLGRLANNYERYLYHLRYIKHSVDDIFDRVQRGRGYHNFFFSLNSFDTEEFILPTEDVNAITNLPMDTESWEIWRHVRPVRLVAHDSNEFTINFLNDNFHYTTIPPSYAVIQIDIVALALKYWSWYNYGREFEVAKEMAEQTPQLLFMHKYVLCDLVWDNANAWIINQLSRMLEYIQTHPANGSEREFNANSLETDAQWGRIAMNATEGFRYLARLFSDTTTAIRPEAFISSKLLLDSTLYNRVDMLLNRLSLPNLQQYQYLLWLRDKNLIKFIYGVYKLQPDLGATSQMNLALRRDFKRLVIRKPWLTCNNQLLKNQMEEEMNEFLIKL